MNQDDQAFIEGVRARCEALSGPTQSVWWDAWDGAAWTVINTDIPRLLAIISRLSAVADKTAEFVDTCWTEIPEAYRGYSHSLQEKGREFDFDPVTLSELEALLDNPTRTTQEQEQEATEC